MNLANSRRRLLIGTATSAMAVFAASHSATAAPLQPNDDNTTTPIKHVIVIVGENRTFDHLFGTYQPRGGQTVSNLLSKGIVNADGSPGPKFSIGAQTQANSTSTYSQSPAPTQPYTTLPPPNTGSTPTAPSDKSGPPFATLAYAEQVNYGLFPRDLPLLLTGASGLPTKSVDTRIANANNLPNGPYPLSPGLSYDDYANSPVHRFYQMWQQTDCSFAHATASNPSGCLNDLFPWVEVTVGAGSNGKPPPPNFNDEITNEGATSMGFYNVSKGDVRYFKQLADEYAIADNYHQPVMGGTGANSIMIGTADALYYTDGNGNAITPPPNQIENPNPQPNTSNYYTQDGYSGGSYSACADANEPGVTAILGYLASLPNKPNPNCDPGHYYLLNNYNPGYYGDGTVAPTGSNVFTIPPSPVKTIADSLLAAQVSWRYYGEGWNAYVQDSKSPIYCNICNPFHYETAVMTNDAVRSNNLKDTTDFYNDIQDSTLPAVSFVKPGGLNMAIPNPRSSTSSRHSHARS